MDAAWEVSATIPLAIPRGRAWGADLGDRPVHGTAVNLLAVEVVNSSTLLPEMRNSWVKPGTRGELWPACYDARVGTCPGET